MTAPLPSAGPAGAVVQVPLADLEQVLQMARTQHRYRIAGRLDAILSAALTPPPAQPRDAGEVGNIVAYLREQEAKHRKLASLNRIVPSSNSATRYEAMLREGAARNDERAANKIAKMIAALSAPASPAVGAEASVLRDRDGREIRPPQPMMYANAEWHEQYARWHVRYIRALLRQEAAPTPQDQGAGGAVWQPVETIPKDGTWFLVSGGVAHWHDGVIKTLTGEEYPGRRIEWPVLAWQPIPQHTPAAPPPRPDDRGVMVDHPNDANFEDDVPEPQQDEGETP